MAYCDLGEALRAMGRVDEAIAAYRAAIDCDLQCAEAHANLGVALTERGPSDEALAHSRRAIELRPDHAIFHYNLGNLLRKRGAIEEAGSLFRRTVELQPELVIGWNSLGNVAAQSGRYAEAVPHFRRAVELKADYAAGWFNLGNALTSLGKFGEAITAFQQAVRFKPELPDAWNNLGGALLEKGMPDEAAAAYRRALQIRPDFAEACSNLGKALVQLRRFDEAIATCRQAITLRPDLSTTWIDMGNALKEVGELDEAIAAYRRAVESHPLEPVGQSNTIYALHFSLRSDEAIVACEQRRWNERFGQPKGAFSSHSNAPLSDRRLRIGYVSPEFRDHVTGRYLVPLFKNHDHADFEIVCYSGVIDPDPRTDEFCGLADRWRSTKGMADDAMAEMIRADEVDILVDLTQHLADNRLPVFAHRAAPLQISFAGYPESSGVEAIEYRVSDRCLDSKIEDRRWEIGAERRNPKSELRPVEQIFLIDTFWCYDPCGVEIEIGHSPALAERPVRFGCLNNFCKTNETVLRLWARLLREVQSSQITLLCPEGQPRERVLELLKREGIDSRRVGFVEMRERTAYLELYNTFDIALDPFPYNGHTTTLDALWMGVPVVSLAGQSAVARGSFSQLANLGLEEFAAFSTDDYLRIAMELAGDRARLAELRRNLRPRLQASPLMDGARFTRQIEAAYRTMWRRWCERGDRQSSHS
jgi:predicted O-linked N-acetylglucosamine transferase (SPINDLY family)